MALWTSLPHSHALRTACWSERQYLGFQGLNTFLNYHCTHPWEPPTVGPSNCPGHIQWWPVPGHSWAPASEWWWSTFPKHQPRLGMTWTVCQGEKLWRSKKRGRCHAGKGQVQTAVGTAAFPCYSLYSCSLASFLSRALLEASGNMHPRVRASGGSELLLASPSAARWAAGGGRRSQRCSPLRRFWRPRSC